ncbi:pyruvate dehydrogenase complex, E2 component, dihydrolipoamide acetyltransferase [Baumannia cicadellinicola str. Hc (Homalodisca coagulata)]|uniref:Dihydrolipoyllysine-residue acetyltransferase component of pyruvate dehydrogenase complex n=2 Tax=Candidatus Palibaumannia cicadellinicola TaxID=186490 RepID=Q1LSX2_BAUCH|nr:pyruvate dehydrogenase complex, E2 component, dihydrolipoamide acetyltransferase [Baumannia cicadellinicola str. Hc (Homalodisca coagulata)]
MLFDIETATIPLTIKENIDTNIQLTNNNHNILPTISVKNNENCKLAIKNDYLQNESYFYATPAIRSLAREFNINLNNIKGTGRKGRILREDIQKYIKNIIYRHEISDKQIIPITSNNKQNNRLQFKDIKEIQLGSIQKKSSSNLYTNWITIPHVTQFHEANITKLEKFRKEQNSTEEIKKLNIKITLLIFVMKAVSKALEIFPLFNSSLSEDGTKLICKKYINIGIAVDTPSGLLVPVCHNVNKKGIITLSQEVINLAQKAHTGKLIPSDMQDSCFTISNLGNIGGMHFTPIINAPEVAILGVSKTYFKPVWNGEKFIPLQVLPLSLSYDHRVINGGDGARFINFIGHIMSDIRLFIM